MFLRREGKREREYRNATDYENMPYHSKFLIKGKTGLEVPNPLTLHYQRDLNLWLRISCSFAWSCADHLKAFSSYFWVRRTRLAAEDGRPTCVYLLPPVISWHSVLPHEISVISSEVRNFGNFYFERLCQFYFSGF